MFSVVGKRTPVAARFSILTGDAGAADTMRDPRGFALKFYTEQGNWDLVANNTPIFFIRDPILFPSFIHSQKRLPASHLKDANMAWDFWSLRPESLHMQTRLFSDRGIPDGYRFMNGYGSNTFGNVNADGELTYVKYHFKTDQGIRNMPTDEAAFLAGADPDYANRDLFEAIAGGEFPSWTLYIQTMTPEQAKKHKDIAFDVTKVWPHGDFPLKEVGRLVLNKNPRNYFAEIEQLAFSPSHMVPGITPSPDKMLQGRLFSYPDTLRHRLGKNYQQIPVNRPLNEPQTYQRDGPFVVNGNMGDAPTYFPNSMGGPEEVESLRYTKYDGEHTVVDKYSSACDDNITQVQLFYRKVLDEEARERLTDNIATSLIYASKKVQERTLANFKEVDEHYARRVKEKMDQMLKAKESVPKSKKRITAPLNPPRKGFEPVAP
jgi:catalase